MKRPTRRQVLVACLVSVSLIGLLIWLTRRQVHQEQQNRALVAAVKAGDVSAVRALLASGASANATEGPVLSGWWAVLRHLLPKKQAAQPPYSPALLLIATDDGAGPFNLPIVQALIEHGADINAQNAHGDTVLMQALQWSDLLATDYLLRHNPNVRLSNSQGETALTFAIRHGDTAMVRRLLEQGADVFQRDKEGAPITFALVSVTGVPDTREKLRLLLDRGVDINAQDKKGGTLLMLLAGQGAYDDIVGDLLRQGADVHKKDSIGATALDAVRFALQETNDPYYNPSGLKKIEHLLLTQMKKNRK